MITEYNKILLENYTTTTNSILFNLDPAAMWHSVAQHGKTLANTFANPSAELWQHHALPGAPLESPDLPPGGGCSRVAAGFLDGLDEAVLDLVDLDLAQNGSQESALAFAQYFTIFHSAL